MKMIASGFSIVTVSYLLSFRCGSGAKEFRKVALTKKDAALSSWLLLIDERPEEDKDASEKGSRVEF